MPEKDPSLWDSIALYLSLIITWGTGAAGQIYVSGGVGGAVRWIMEIKGKSPVSFLRILFDGVTAVITGAIFARYLGPVIAKWLAGVGMWPDAGDATTAGFLAGVGGMSVAKVVIAMIDAQSHKFTGKK
ncbi:hypothetical protein [Thioclava kandeliae]|uniref:Holin n=1 Tax=Thioclava kandeliae TaxID=3070818 RepID=A0ABV1SIE7_9RHOB